MYVQLVGLVMALQFSLCTEAMVQGKAPHEPSEWT